MFDRLPALSQRVSRARAQRRVSRGNRPTPVAPRGVLAFGESMAVGLGCDNWKFQR